MTGQLGKREWLLRRAVLGFGALAHHVVLLLDDDKDRATVATDCCARACCKSEGGVVVVEQRTRLWEAGMQLMPTTRRRRTWQK
jgi:hypothetical protein